MAYCALVLGEDTRSFLSVVRSLGKMGIKVDVVCYNKTSPALTSKFINQAWHFNYQAYTQSAWLEHVIDLVNDTKYDLVIPCDERAIFPLSANKSRFPDDCHLALPNDAVLEHLFDKFKTKALAIKCQVPVARGELLAIKDMSYQQLVNMFGVHFVIKPTESFNADKLASRNKVAMIYSNSDFEAYTEHLADPEELFLIEELFEGTGEGVSLMAVKGHVQYLFAHTRVNEPRNGGGSSYRKAIPVHPDMAQACIAICQETEYDGVGMFEFKHNLKTGRWILVEVNARFWGSLPLAIHAGIDFPKHYASYLLGHYTPLAQPHADYALNAYARNFTSDIYDMRAEMQYVQRNEGALPALGLTLKRLSSFRRLIDNEKIDSFDTKDKAPFNSELKQLLDNTVGDRMAKMFAKLPIKPVNQVHPLNKLLQLMYALEGKGRMVFVCYGNIMRSPLAEKICSVLVNNSQLGFETASYGFHQNTQRKSPDECIKAASKLGIDLTAHRSQWLQQKDIQSSDILFVFDRKNETLLESFYTANNVFNLAVFIPSGLGVYDQIEDPYNKGLDETIKCYLLITEAIKLIIEAYLANHCEPIPV